MTKEHHKILQLIQIKRFFKRDWDAAVIRLVYDVEKGCDCMLVEFFDGMNLLRQSRFRSRKWIATAEWAFGSKAAFKEKMRAAEFASTVNKKFFMETMALVVEAFRVDETLYHRSFYHPIVREDKDIWSFLNRAKTISEDFRNGK